MKKIVCIAVCLMAALSVSSCYSTRISYGQVEQNEPLVQVNRTWNHHIIAGLVPVGNNKVKSEKFVPGQTNYVVKTNQSFLNLLVGAITFGIYTPTQTTFYVPLRDVPNGNIQTDAN